MAAGSIIVDLLMRTGSFETDTKRAEKRLRELQKEAEQVGKAIGIAFVAIGAASVALVKSAIDAADATGKLAQQTGTTVEELSALTYAAGLADVSQEELGAALIKLTKNMSDAADGSGEAAKGFTALGISVKNADGSLKSSDQVLREVAEKFSGFRDGAEKTALAVNLFGKSGAQLIPLLNAGAAGLEEMKREAQALGVVIDTETSKAAEDFNDNLTRLSSALQGVGNVAAKEMLPALNEVSGMLVELAKNEAFVSTTTEIVKAVIGGLVNVFQTVAVVGSDVGFVFLSVGREIGAWAAQIAALGRGDLSGFRAISDAVKADGERARAELDKFQARVMSIGEPKAPKAFRPSDNYGPANTPNKPNAPRLAGSGGSKAAKDRQTDAERYLETLQKQVERTQDLTVVEKLLADISSGRLKITGKVSKDQLLAAATAVDQAKYEEEQRRNLAEAINAERESRVKSAEAAMDEARSLEEGNKALKDEIEEMGLSTEGRYALEQARLSSAIAVAKDRLETLKSTDQIGMETMAVEDQIAALEKRQELLGKRATKEIEVDQAKKMEDEAQRARDTIEGTLGQGIEDALNGNFKNIGDNWKAMLNRMVAEALSAEIMKSVFGKASGGDPLGGIMKQLGLIGEDKAAAGKGQSATGGTGETGGGLLSMFGFGSKTADKASGEAGILSMFAEPAEKGAQSLGDGLVDARSEVDRFSALMPTLSSAMSEFGAASGKAGSALSLLPSIISAISGGGGGSSGGGGFTGLLSSFVGSLFSGGSGSGITTGDSPLSATGEMIRGRRAAGGPVSSGGAYLIGERGPEVFVPSTSGRVLPNTPATWGAGGGERPINVNINQTFAPNSTRATTDQAAAQAGMAARKAVARTR